MVPSMLRCVKIIIVVGYHYLSLQSCHCLLISSLYERISSFHLGFIFTFPFGQFWSILFKLHLVIILNFSRFSQPERIVVIPYGTGRTNYFLTPFNLHLLRFFSVLLFNKITENDSKVQCVSFSWKIYHKTSMLLFPGIPGNSRERTCISRFPGKKKVGKIAITSHIVMHKQILVVFCGLYHETK